MTARNISADGENKIITIKLYKM